VTGSTQAHKKNHGCPPYRPKGPLPRIHCENSLLASRIEKRPCGPKRQCGRLRQSTSSISIDPILSLREQLDSFRGERHNQKRMAAPLIIHSQLSSSSAAEALMPVQLGLAHISSHFWYFT